MSRAGQSEWRLRAKALIARLTAELSEDATVEERRKTLWGKGWSAHHGTVWGRKIWGQEVRKYLARHGDKRAYSVDPQFQWPDHVHFPFREGSQDV